MVETLTHVYTSQAEMESVFSVDGILLRMDDDGSAVIDGTEVSNLSDIFDEATDEVNIRVEQRYDPSVLVNNLWVRRAATYIACYIASIRLGNAEQYRGQRDYYIGLLERVKEHKMVIPRLPVRYNEQPGMSNLIIDHHFPKSKIRVETENSVGGTYPDMDADRPGLSSVDI